LQFKRVVNLGWEISAKPPRLYRSATIDSLRWRRTADPG
jgi:hypothetical protein